MMTMTLGWKNEERLSRGTANIRPKGLCVGLMKRGCAVRGREERRKGDVAGERSGGWQPVGRSRRRLRFYCKKSHYPLFNGRTNIFPATTLATDSCNFSGCRSDGGTEGQGRGGIMATPYANVERASERAIPPLLKTRNEIQLTNCFLAAAAAFVSRQTGGGTEERCEGTKFAFGARNSV